MTVSSQPLYDASAQLSPPQFIPESDEIRLLRDSCVAVIHTASRCQVAAACNVLKSVLFRRYGPSYALPVFVQDANRNHNESDIFSKHLLDVFTDANWSLNTQRTMFYILKKVLAQTAIVDAFIQRLTMRPKSALLSKHDPNAILRREYAILPPDHPVKARLVQWIGLIREKTRNRSPASIRSIVAFFLNVVLPKLNLCLEYWDPARDLRLNPAILRELLVPPIEQSDHNTSCHLKSICNQKSYVTSKRTAWMRFFCTSILHLSEETYETMHMEALHLPTSHLPPHQQRADAGGDVIISSHAAQPVPFFDKDYQSGDKHTLTAQELQALYTQAHQQSESSAFDMLMFMLLITTGMRVGGFVNIRLQHVADPSGKQLVVLQTGRTLEKGNKWYEFVITPPVQLLLHRWITTERKGNSDFLFPSLTTLYGHIATNTVRSRFHKLCTAAGLSGPHLHLHSLRHTYAHILLACGNDVTVISKLLHHASTATTEQFYLKETISQVVDRANIPWLNPENKPSLESIIPPFLTATQTKIQKISVDKSENKVKNKEKKLQRLDLLRQAL